LKLIFLQPLRQLGMSASGVPDTSAV